MVDRSVIRNRAGVGRRAPEGRRVLDLAEGVLVGVRRYSAESALEELVFVAQRHDISVSAAAAAASVDLATGDADAADSSCVAQVIAHHQWGDLLTTPAASTHRG